MNFIFTINQTEIDSVENLYDENYVYKLILLHDVCIGQFVFVTKFVYITQQTNKDSSYYYFLH